MSDQYDEKIEAARAWMESRKIHQLGTEHLKTSDRRIVSELSEDDLLTEPNF
jgi:hypothetical protein